MSITARAKVLAQKTSDAHSVARYGSWPACAQRLVSMGMTDLEVEAVLRSKWMRWAADSSDERYGRVPARMIQEALDKSFKEREGLQRELDDLVVGTFGADSALVPGQGHPDPANI